jgi:hypothetical protein
MDGLIDQLAWEAGLYRYVSVQTVGIGDLQNLSHDFFNARTSQQSVLGTNQSATGTRCLFQFS